MIKRILFIGFLISALAAISWWLFNFQQAGIEKNNAWSAIPENAGLVMEFKNPKSLWEKHSQTNLIWKELKDVDFFSETNETFIYLDSVYSANPIAARLFNPGGLLVSFHLSGAETVDRLYSQQIPEDVSEEEIHQLAKLSFSNQNPLLKKYDDSEIYTFKINDKKTASLCVLNGVVVFSENMILVEDAVRQLSGVHAVEKSRAFQKIKSTSGNNSEAVVYVQYNRFPELLGNLFVKTDFMPIKNDFASWSSLDVSINPEYIFMHGFTNSFDSLNQYIDIFRGQHPGEMNLKDMLPVNTSILYHVHLSNPSLFYDKHTSFLKSKGMYFENEKRIKQLKLHFNVDIHELTDLILGQEVAYLTTETQIDDVFNHEIVLLRSPSESAANKFMKSLIENPDLKQHRDTAMYEFGEFKIYDIGLTNLPELLFGSPFRGSPFSVCTTIGDIIVFANSIEGMKEYLKFIQDGRTLSMDLNFRSYMEQHSGLSNLFFYMNISRSPIYLKKNMNKKFKLGIDMYTELLRKFDGFSFQMSAESNGLYYNNVFLRYSPTYEQHTSRLWECRLDTNVFGKVHKVKNHYTNAWEVFVQDANHKVYLISTTGGVIWSKKMEGPIVGDVKQIDVYKNGKLQLLFNTTNKIYLLDRKGNDVDGFPFIPTEKISNEVRVFDYENNKNYRMFFALKDNSIVCLDKTGEVVKGWKFDKTQANVNKAIHYFSINKKDYIQFVDRNGKVYICDRRGKIRVPIKSVVNGFNYNLKPEQGRKIDNTILCSSDSSGLVSMLSFDDKIDTFRILDKNSKCNFFIYDDLNGDKKPDFLFGTDKGYFAYTGEKRKLFEFSKSCDDKLPNFAGIFFVKNAGIETGYVCSKTKELHLLDANGLQHEHFPIQGEVLFQIVDINADGTANLITAEQDKVVTYNIK